MCEYASFCVDKNLNIYAGMYLDSHEGIEAGWDLKPGEYHEAEWTGEEPETLVIRAEDTATRVDLEWRLLAKFPARKKLLRKIMEGRGANGNCCEYKNGQRHGRFLTFHSNGQRRIDCTYHRGKLEGRYREWDSDGQIIDLR